MDTGLLHLHNFLRWAVIILAVLTLVKAAMGMSGNKPFTNGDRKTALFLMISCDIQLLLGLALFFMRGWFNALSSGGAMAQRYTRFFTVEHGLGMIAAIVLIHIGYSATKKAIADEAKHKRLFWFTLVAMILILATVPWPWRDEIARPLFPGMGV